MEGSSRAVSFALVADGHFQPLSVKLRRADIVCFMPVPPERSPSRHSSIHQIVLTDPRRFVVQVSLRVGEHGADLPIVSILPNSRFESQSLINRIIVCIHDSQLWHSLFGPIANLLLVFLRHILPKNQAVQTARVDLYFGPFAAL